MTITIRTTGKMWPRIFRGIPQTDEQKRDFHFSAWKRFSEDGKELPPGMYEVAIMSHIHGIPEKGTIVPIHSMKEHEGAVVGDRHLVEGSMSTPLLTSHSVITKFE